jgi:hypothetical protein
VAELIYSAITSLDGYVADEDGNFDWAAPVVVGGGTRSLPDGVRWDVDLAEERRFGNGVVHLRYRTRT